jgi:lactate permease
LPFRYEHNKARSATSRDAGGPPCLSDRYKIIINYSNFILSFLVLQDEEGGTNMWPQPLQPLPALAPSLLLALTPPATLLLLTGLARLSVLRATLLTIGVALGLALLVWQMPVALSLLALLQGALVGATGIGWVILAGLFAVEILRQTGDLDAICADLRALSPNPSLQALLIGFCLNGFLESICGYGVPVLTVAMLLRTLDWPWTQAAVVALIGNSLTVAFGALGTPTATLASLTNLNAHLLFPTTALIMLPIATLGLPLFVRLTCGREALQQYGWLATRTGLCFGLVQVLAAAAGAGELAGAFGAAVAAAVLVMTKRPRVGAPCQITRLGHWSPLLLFISLLLIWSLPPVATWLATAELTFPMPGLHGQIAAPGTGSPLPALLHLNIIAHPGTALLLGSLATGLHHRGRSRTLLQAARLTWQRAATNLTSTVLLFALATLIADVGMANTISLGISESGPSLPFIAPLIGWIGGLLTGSATSANALFGPAQVSSALMDGISPYAIAAANTISSSLAKMASPLAVGLLDGVESTQEVGGRLPAGRLTRYSLLYLALLVPLVLLCNFLARLLK